MRNKRKTVVTALLASAMVLGSLPAYAAESAPTGSSTFAVGVDREQAAAAEGERIFRAIYSGAGDEKLRIPRIAAPDAAVEPHGKAWNELVQQVALTEPGYLAEFGRQMRSGDPYLVTEALEGGQARIEAAIKKLYPTASTKQTESDMGANCTVGAVACAVVAVAVSTGGAVLNYVAAVNVVAVVNAGTWVNGFWGIARPDENSPGGEAFIRDLTVRLAD
ncbi:hypothetical protein ACQPWR_05310 [Micromonospora vinacea]|uniref:hypothetical protein n=1 Tax=Micromonospora vinacea TaxID=709878 RepID=UPI003D8AC290